MPPQTMSSAAAFFAFVAIAAGAILAIAIGDADAACVSLLCTIIRLCRRWYSRADSVVA